MKKGGGGGGGDNNNSKFVMVQRPDNKSPTSSQLSQQEELHQKAEEINLVLLQPDVDLWKLRELALSEGGLVNDTLRKRAWPKLVGLHKYYKYKPHFYKPKSQIADLLIHEEDAQATSTPKFEIDTSEMGKFEMISHPKQNNDDDEDDDSDAGQPHREDDDDDHDDDDNDYDDHEAPIGGAGGGVENPFSHLIAESMDAEQIERDVARCTWHLLSGTQRSRRVQYHNKQRKKVAGILRKKQKRLANLINLTLVESYELAPSEEDRLRYYQGYHDVACIFLHALGGGNTKPQDNKSSNTQNNNNNSNTTTNNNINEGDKLGLELPARVLCQVSYSHFRDHLRSDFLSLQTALRVALFPLLAKLDKQVHDHLRDCDMEPFFCLSWVLTWFSHDVRDTELVKRLFDVFLCSHPLFSLYVAIAMMVHPVNRSLILQTDCDFAAVHQCLVSLPRNSCRVGWKKRCDGLGYVSDEEDPNQADDMTASTGIDSGTYWDQEEKSMSLATSTSLGHSTSLTSIASSFQSFSVGPITVEDSCNRVPFQELIDQGLTFMRRFPPRCLLKLAKKYFKEEWNIGQQVSNISLLQNPPTWSLASTAKADWVLKQRVRQDLGLKATSRKDRRKKARLMQQHVKEDTTKTQPTEKATPLVDMEYLRTHKHTLPVIAVGYGPDPVDPKARKRRRQMRIAIAVAAGAIIVGIAYRQYQLRSSGTTPLISNNYSESDVPSVGLAVDEITAQPSASPSGVSGKAELSKPVLSPVKVKESTSSSVRGADICEGGPSPRDHAEVPIQPIPVSKTESASEVQANSDVSDSQAISTDAHPHSNVEPSSSTIAPAENDVSSSSIVRSLDDKVSQKDAPLPLTLSNHPTIVALKKTTRSIVRVFQYFGSRIRTRIFSPLLRIFAPGQKSINKNDDANFIILGSLASGKNKIPKGT